MHGGEQCIDGKPVRAGTCTDLMGTGETRRGPCAEPGVFAACQLQVAVILRVHPGAQHVSDGHTVWAGALAVVTGMATIRVPVHPGIALQEGEVVARRRPPTRRTKILIDACRARHGDDQSVHIRIRQDPAEGRLGERRPALFKGTHVVEACAHEGLHGDHADPFGFGLPQDAWQIRLAGNEVKRTGKALVEGGILAEIVGHQDDVDAARL